MPTKKITAPTSSQTRKKHCHKGYRTDKKTGICVKHDIFSTFKELKDEDISAEGKTITLESQGDSGVIFKLYHEGDIQHQLIVPNHTLHKVKKRTHSHVKHIFKTMRKMEPNTIANNKKYQQFKRNLDKHTVLMKGGTGGGTPVAKTKILVHDEVFHSVTSDKVAALQANVNMLQTKLNKRLNQEHTQSHNNYWSVFFLVNFLQEVITNQLVPTVTVNGPYWTGYGKTMIEQIGPHSVSNYGAMGTPLSIDLYGGLFMVVLNIITLFYPNGEMDEITKTAQYVYWSWLIVSSPWLIASMGWWGLASIITPVLGFYTSTQMTPPTSTETTDSSTAATSKTVMKLQQQLSDAKKELATAMVADANQSSV